MSRMIFVNLPVKDLQRSVAFFGALGFEFNPMFSDENATAMIVNDQATGMLLVEEFYATFTPKSIADATRVSEVLVGVSAESRDEVDSLVDKAVESGADEAGEPMDMGEMYQRAFHDLDGHKWEIIWMDPAFTG
jgi:predicted lactoylglutathione lyase